MANLTIGDALDQATLDALANVPEIKVDEPAPAPVKASRGRPRADGTPAQSKSDPNYTPPPSDTGPKDVPVFGPDSPLPRRGRRTRSAAVAPAPNIDGGQIADVVYSAHQMAAALVKGADITPEQAKKIGNAAVPVIEDFGIVVAGKAVHLVLFFAAIISVELPVAINVVNEMNREAARRRAAAQGMEIVGQSAGPVDEKPKQQSKPAPTPSDTAAIIARQLGVEVGAPATGV